MNDIREIITSPSATLKSAMEQMTRSRKGFLLVANEMDQLLGVVTDGDVRRAILNSMLLQGPVSQIMNTDPTTCSSSEEGFSLMDQRSLAMVPVLDKERILKGVVVEEEGKKKSFENQRATKREGKEGGILVIIPARGGSKRIPEKNLQKVGGLTLVARAIKTAQEAFNTAYILVSTDDEKIAEEAKRKGVPVPWLRPANLSTDQAGTFEVVEHALAWAQKEHAGNFDTIMLLEPTAPLRLARHLKEAVTLFRESGCDSVVSVSELPHVFHPEEITRITSEGNLVPFLPERKMHTRLLRGRQDKLFVQNGIVYVFKPETILKKKNLYGDRSVPLITEWQYFSDIDDYIDLIVAESKLESQR